MEIIWNDRNSQPRWKIVFNRTEGRQDPVGSGINEYETSVLNNVEMYANSSDPYNGNSWQLVRRYVFSQTWVDYIDTRGDGRRHLRLDKIQEQGGDGSSTMPAWTFTYQSRYLRYYVDGQRWDQQLMPFLTEASNGCGGKVTFQYEDNENNIPSYGSGVRDDEKMLWHVLKTRKVYDGRKDQFGNVLYQQQDYSGTNPRFSTYENTYGNWTDMWEYASASDANWYRHTRRGFATYPNTADWIVDKPNFVNLYAWDGTYHGAWKASTAYYYSGNSCLPPNSPSMYGYDQTIQKPADLRVLRRQWDDNGTITEADTFYEYAENRLIRVRENGTEIRSFAYDGDGALRTVVQSGQTIHYVTPDYRYNLTSGEPTVYYRFNGKAVAWRNNSALRYVLSDHLSSTHGEAGENQAEMGQRRYLPFGSDRAVTGASDITDEERFTSQRRIDAGNGNARGALHNYGTRWCFLCCNGCANRTLA